MAKGESWEGMHEMTDRQKAQAAIDGIDLYLHQVFGDDPKDALYAIVDAHEETPARIAYEVRGVDRVRFEQEVRAAVDAARTRYGSPNLPIELHVEGDRFMVIAMPRGR